MRGALGAVDLANTVRLMRAGYRGAILLVEGSTDSRVYVRLVDGALCRVVPGYGKETTLGALEILIHDGVPGIAGVVDADFVRIVGGSPASVNVFVTDAHDLEMVMVASPAIDKVVEEFVSSGKVKGKNVRAMLLSAAEIIGCLRLVSLQLGLNLKFENISFGAFVDTATMRVDVDKLIQEVKNKSKQPKLDVKAVKASVLAEIGRHNPLDVCCGHDVIGVLSVGLRKAIGSSSAGAVSPEILERSLRLAYERAHFLLTDLNAAFTAWPNANPGYRIV